MNGDDYRLARMHQEDLLKEAQHVRLVREALGSRARRGRWRYVLAQTGAVLIRIGERLRADYGRSAVPVCHTRK